jgi:hypothetical protein
MEGYPSKKQEDKLRLWVGRGGGILEGRRRIRKCTNEGCAIIGRGEHIGE